MSTITINTCLSLSDTVAREELVETIGRLSVGGDTRTEIIDDRTGEVLCTCQGGQVQMTTEVLAAVLAKKRDVPLDNGVDGEDTNENDNDEDTQPRSITVAGITFHVGDRVQAKRDARANDEYTCHYNKKEKGILVNIDETDNIWALCVRFDRDHIEWVRAEDFDIISR